MLIKGLQKTTLLDYPGKIACIVFLAGCNFRCPFCQNPELVVDSDKLPTISEEEILKFLQSRIGKLDGVVITGGEPTIHEDLLNFTKKIKDLGFLVKLDTNGTNPGMTKNLIKQKLVDYVAMDFKGPLTKYYQYANITKTRSKIATSASRNIQINKQISKCINILIESGIDFELRTTVVPELHAKEDLIKMAREIKMFHVPCYVLHVKWFLQNFRPNKCLDKRLEELKPYQKKFYDKLLPELRRYIPKTEVRGI